MPKTPRHSTHEKKNERRGENMDKIPEYIRLMKEDREYLANVLQRHEDTINSLLKRIAELERTQR
jgi:hypothetical protein